MDEPMIETWTGNIVDIGAVYPFQGSEILLVLIGVVLWIAWHVRVFRLESEELRKIAEDFKGELLHEHSRVRTHLVGTEERED